MGIPKEERQKGAENLFEEIMARNFPNLRMEMDNQIQKALKTSAKRNPKRPH